MASLICQHGLAQLRAASLLAIVCALAIAGKGIPAYAQETDFAHCAAFERAACDRTLAAQPQNLTALFMRGLASELQGDHRMALTDFDAVINREPRHFGAQLWRYVAAARLGESHAAELASYLDAAKSLGDWPRVLALLYLGQASPEQALSLAARQKGAAAAEAVCAAEYHIGRAAALAGRMDEAMAHFRAAQATGAVHVFEYQAADRAIRGMP
jgi:lipoprotein NlpI